MNKAIIPFVVIGLATAPFLTTKAFEFHKTDQPKQEVRVIPMTPPVPEVVLENTEPIDNPPLPPQHKVYVKKHKTDINKIQKEDPKFLDFQFNFKSP